VVVTLSPIARLDNSASIVVQHALPYYTINVGEFHPVLEVVCRHERHREAGDGSGRNSEFSVAHVGGCVGGGYCVSLVLFTWVDWRRLDGVECGSMFV